MEVSGPLLHGALVQLLLKEDEFFCKQLFMKKKTDLGIFADFIKCSLDPKLISSNFISSSDMSYSDGIPLQFPRVIIIQSQVKLMESRARANPLCLNGNTKHSA